jgi:hypothetical protein
LTRFLKDQDQDDDTDVHSVALHAWEKGYESFLKRMAASKIVAGAWSRLWIHTVPQVTKLVDSRNVKTREDLENLLEEICEVARGVWFGENGDDHKGLSVPSPQPDHKGLSVETVLQASPTFWIEFRIPRSSCFLGMAGVMVADEADSTLNFKISETIQNINKVKR